MVEALDRELEVEDVADGGLAGFEAVVAGENRAVDDAAEAGYVGQGLVIRPDADVAGACPDDLDEFPRRDARPDGAGGWQRLRWITLPLMRRLKARWDPKGYLNPGAFLV